MATKLERAAIGGPAETPDATLGEARIAPTLSLASWEDAERLFRSRRDAVVPVTQPLVLVSQLQRSGGTLVNSLLDGHPELHVHPYELHIGHPTKADWPSLDMEAGVDKWLSMLSEPVLEKLFRAGYRKKPDMDDMAGFPSLPFTVVPTLIESLFRLLCADQPPRSQRDVIDRYMTAFFNAWVDNQGLREETKRWVAAFAPRTAWGDSRARWSADYPDGRIVSLFRDPRAWYASASRFSGRYGALDEAIELWCHAAREIVAAKTELSNRVFVMAYERLVQNPAPAMRQLGEWLGIAWSPSLVLPTFNRLPVRPNSSYDLPLTGVRPEPLERWRTVLDKDTVTTIENRTSELYRDLRSTADFR